MSTRDGMTVEERGGPERRCTGTDTVDGYRVTCAEVALEADFCPHCREAAQAERIARLEEALREIAAHDDTCVAWQRDYACDCQASIARAALAPAKP